jgi:hypothetical protein
MFSLDLYQEFAVGYYDDLGVTLGLRVEDTASDFPLYIQGRLGATYQVEPGNAEDARQFFINDNQGGNIEEYGQSYFLALDLGWKMYAKGPLNLELNVSGLLNHYQAHFTFIGNNESFTVKTTSFGIGLGANLRILFSEINSSLMVKGGVEYFPKTRIDAHGTYYYTPDGEDDNPRNDYTYDNADESINQPSFRPYVQIGLLFPIG